MPIAKRARVVRAKVVKKEVLFHEAMGLVQVHHSGHLNSFEADRKAVRDAVAPCRAHAIVEAIETQHNMYNWVGTRADGGDNVARMNLRREAQLAGYHQIREFAPELVPDPADVDWDEEFYLDVNGECWEDHDDLFRRTRQEYREYAEFEAEEATRMRLYQARALLKACDDERTEANLGDALAVAVRQITEFAPEFIKTRDDTVAAFVSRVYLAYNLHMEGRIHRLPSFYESMHGESTRVRHSEAHRMAAHVLEATTHRYFYVISREERDRGHRQNANRVIEIIKVLAPELVPDEEDADEEDADEEDADPWLIIRRVIADTA